MRSVVSYPDRGPWGDPRYRGNCSGRLIEDIIDFRPYHISELCDFMVGSGTTEEVCRDKKIPGTFLDLNRGYDMMTMDIPVRPENIFWHPPYAGMIVYSDKMYKASEIEEKYGFDPRINDLSRCKDWEDFVDKMNYCMLKQYAALEKGGRMFVLMGDWKQKGRLYSMLCDIAKPGLEQIIIKMQHNCVSDLKTYSNQNFVPIEHEYLMVCHKDGGIMIPVSVARKYYVDIRNSTALPWRDIIAAVFDEYGSEMSLEELYDKLDGSKKAEQNGVHWREKIRQTLQIHPETFTNVSRGRWALAA